MNVETSEHLRILKKRCSEVSKTVTGKLENKKEHDVAASESGKDIALERVISLMKNP